MHKAGDTDGLNNSLDFVKGIFLGLCGLLKETCCFFMASQNSRGDAKINKMLIFEVPLIVC